MNISVNWLRDYITTPLSDAEIAEKLTLTGLEVEEMKTTGSAFEGVVVGKILKVTDHPNADKLRLCEVDTGSASVQIVCGAPNVAAGQKVAVATVGTLLPVELENGKPLVIRKSKIRGEQSFGMICAEDELGIGQDHSGIMVLDEGLPAGTPFSEVVKPTRDTVLEIGLTPNRPDAACHLGTARDLAAVTGQTLQHPGENARARFAGLKTVAEKQDSITIKIIDDARCGRYVGLVMRGLRIGESPAWVQQRLSAIGLRPRNAVVDATNYVLHELGQPLHAFDLHQLAGAEIQVKSFDEEIKFTTLDEVERKVPAGSLFICDAEKPVALAGIMGGQNSEISDHSTDILIESAWFDPVSIRKTSKKLALQTDSSYRFERGVDPTLSLNAALRCAELIQSWCGGELEQPVVDHTVRGYEAPEIALRPERANKIMGARLETARMQQILERLGFSPRLEAGRLRCTVPGFRPDVSAEIDLIEEIARIYDYNNIPTTGRISFARPPELPFFERFLGQVRESCTRLGLMEFYTNSLLPQWVMEQDGAERFIPTLNPISRDQAIMRPSLEWGFTKSAAYNFNRNIPGLRAFEIGRVFRKSDANEDAHSWIEGISERRHLLMGVAGIKQQQHWAAPESRYEMHDLKALLNGFFEQLRLSSQVSYSYEGEQQEIRVMAGQEQLGTARAVDAAIAQKMDLEARAFIAMLDLDKIQTLVSQLPLARYTPIAKYPAFEYDIAFIVDKQVAAADLQQHILEKGGKQLVNIQIFDVFEGKPLEAAQKSIAFRLHFQHPEKTLSISEVEPKVKKITKFLKQKYDAVLRA
ncbi:MAG: phenylalanine--tRNA ligase subunit beta [Cyclonatronaceae bacterium]